MEYIWLRDGKFWKSSTDYDGKILVKETMPNGEERYYLKKYELNNDVYISNNILYGPREIYHGLNLDEFGVFREYDIVSIKNIEYVFGSVNMVLFPNLKDIGSLRYVNGFLSLAGTKTKSLNKLKHINGALYLAGIILDDFGDLEHVNSIFVSKRHLIYYREKFQEFSNIIYEDTIFTNF